MIEDLTTITIKYTKADVLAVLAFSIFLFAISPILTGLNKVTLTHIEGFNAFNVSVCFSTFLARCYTTCLLFDSHTFYTLVTSSTVASVVLHELTHVFLLRRFKVFFKVKTFKVSIIPMGIVLDYRSITIREYVITALAPQALSAIVCLVMLVANRLCLANQLTMFAMLMYVVNLVGGSGDLYGVFKTLVKVRTLDGVIRKVRDYEYVISL